MSVMLMIRFALAPSCPSAGRNRRGMSSSERLRQWYAVILICAGCGVALATNTMVRADESPLTLAQAQRLATLRSKQIEGSDFGVSAAKEMAVAAGQRPDPVATLGVENLPIDGSERFSVQRDFMT
ncbi:MAG: hypothetical protein ACREQD_16715, partial [Candidatus Binataceae bacterium]